MRYLLAIIITVAAMSAVLGQDYSGLGPDAGTPASTQLAIAAENIERLSTWSPSPERTEALDNEVHVTCQFLTEQKVINNTLTSSQLVQMLKDLGFLKSGASTWGKNEVAFCLKEGILVGRTAGTTPESAEWKTYVTREEFATGLARADRRTDEKVRTAVGNHNADSTSHPDIRQTDDWQWYWLRLVGILLGAAILIWVLAQLFRWWRRRRPVPAPAPVVPVAPAPVLPVAPGPPGPPAAAPPAVPAVAPAPLWVPAPPVPAIVPAKNGTGIQL